MSSDTRPEWTHYHAAFIYKKHKNVFIFSIISEHFDGTCSWNLSWRKTGMHLSYVINIMAADDLATQGARASAAMVLT